MARRSSQDPSPALPRRVSALPCSMRMMGTPSRRPSSSRGGGAGGVCSYGDQEILPELKHDHDDPMREIWIVVILRSLLSCILPNRPCLRWIVVHASFCIYFFDGLAKQDLIRYKGFIVPGSSFLLIPCNDGGGAVRHRLQKQPWSPLSVMVFFWPLVFKFCPNSGRLDMFPESSGLRIKRSSGYNYGKQRVVGVFY